MSSKKTEASQPIIRCAIYTRKSTDERLDLQLNSLDSQRGAAEAFIASQKSEGWVCLPKLYDDGGFTGGNLDRPAFKQLMSDIEAGEIDCVVVYKVDRLSRSLLDFARAMETFDAHGVSFVSVTQRNLRWAQPTQLLRDSELTNLRLLSSMYGVASPPGASIDACTIIIAKLSERIRRSILLPSHHRPEERSYARTADNNCCTNSHHGWYP